jgi:hypothetical protein
MKFYKILKIVIYLQLAYSMYLIFYKDVYYMNQLSPFDRIIYYSTIVCVIIILFIDNDNDYVRKL